MLGDKLIMTFMTTTRMLGHIMTLWANFQKIMALLILDC